MLTLILDETEHHKALQIYINNKLNDPCAELQTVDISGTRSKEGVTVTLTVETSDNSPHLTSSIVEVACSESNEHQLDETVSDIKVTKLNGLPQLNKQQQADFTEMLELLSDNANNKNVPKIEKLLDKVDSDTLAHISSNNYFQQWQKTSAYEPKSDGNDFLEEEISQINDVIESNDANDTTDVSNDTAEVTVSKSSTTEEKQVTEEAKKHEQVDSETAPKKSISELATPTKSNTIKGKQLFGNPPAKAKTSPAIGTKKLFAN